MPKGSTMHVLSFLFHTEVIFLVPISKLLITSNALVRSIKYGFASCWHALQIESIVGPNLVFFFFRSGIHKTAFVLSWNIWNGEYQTLHFMNVEDHSGQNFFKTESYLEDSRHFRKNTAIPLGLTSQVRIFSNHTVFSEKSVKYFLHPFLPIILLW